MNPQNKLQNISAYDTRQILKPPIFGYFLPSSLGQVRCKVPKGGPSGGTGIPWQPIGVEPIFAKTPQESEMAPPDSEQYSD